MEPGTAVVASHAAWRRPGGGFPRRQVSLFSLTLASTAVLAAGLIGLPPEAALQMLWPGVGAAVGVGWRAAEGELSAVAAGLAVGCVAILALAGWPSWQAVATSLVLGVVAVAVVILLRALGMGPMAKPADVALLVGTTGTVGVVSCGPAIVIDRIGGGGALGHLPGGWVLGALWGVCAVTPFVLTARQPVVEVPARRVAELVLAAGLTFAAATYTFSIAAAGQPGPFGWPYLVIVGLMLVAVRSGVQPVAALLALVAWFAAAATTKGTGSFGAGGDGPADWLLAVQLFTVVMAVAVVLVAVLTDDRARAFAELQRSSHTFRQVLDASQSQISAKSYREGEGRYILTNRSWAEASGLGSTPVEGATDTELFGGPAGQARRREDLAVMAANHPTTAERTAGEGDDSRVLLTTEFPLRDADGRPWGVGGMATDITPLARAQELQRRQAHRLEAVFTVSPTPAMRILFEEGPEISVVDANHAMLALVGSRPGLQDADFLALVAPNDRAAVRTAVAEACELGHADRAGPTPQVEIRLGDAAGGHRWVLFSAAAVGPREGGRQELVLQFTDITDRKQAEWALSELALTDSVTGLPNRHALLDRLRAALDRLSRHPGVVCVLFCDLDQFKQINDTLGHQVGDRLLIDIAGRLNAATRPDDTVARLGGDEFVVVYEGLRDPMDAVLLAMRLQEAIRSPWQHGEQIFRPTMSVGVASTSTHRTTVDDLLRRADLAMYRAKDAGRDRVQLYDRSLGRALKRTVGIQQRLRAAIDRDDLILHYQPIVDLRDNAVISSEALLRLRGARGRVIPPGEFIPQAETSGLIGPVGAWVLQRALQDLRSRHERGRRHSVSINVSPAQLHRPGFCEMLLEQAANHHVHPGCIVLEMTETALVHDRAHVVGILGELHGAGVSIALDDFGTGYSSLSWLTQFPVDTVKIDRSFTAQLATDPKATAVVSAVIAVAQELNLTVVAEGVETAEQRDRLVDLSCPLAQGYLLGRPVPADDPSWV